MARSLAAERAVVQNATPPVSTALGGRVPSALASLKDDFDDHERQTERCRGPFRYLRIDPP
jgi:hypothetical protein